MHMNVRAIPSSPAAPLTKLYQAVQEFREAMQHDLPLNDFDRISLENYMALLQITYIEWTRRNFRALSYKQAA